MPEKDTERENTYYVTNDVAAEEDQQKNGLLSTLVNIFKF